MVYAIISIGLLGFIVWSQMMAFLICENWVINFTIGWKDFTLLNTFYSLDVNNMIQSAGNSKPIILAYSIFFMNDQNQLGLHRGSSETIRENSYDSFVSFRNSFKNFYGKNFEESDNWLFWLIGFIEGDGAILEHKGRCQLVLTQKDPLVLYEIQTKLGIGIVKNFGNFYRYLVVDNKNCFLIYLLLNGNLVLKHRKEQINKWFISLNKSSNLNSILLPKFNLNNIPSLLKTPFKPDLKNSWISGFTDAEGCFSITILKNRKNLNYVKARFILDLKLEYDTLNHIANLFSPLGFKGSPVKLRSGKTDVFRMTISCNDIKNPNSTLIRNYFTEFKLKTSKQNSFILWSHCLDLCLGKQPLSNEMIVNVKKLSKKINKFTIENNSIGSAKFS